MMKCSALWRWNDHALPHPLARPATGCGTPDLPIDHALVGGPSLELPTWGKLRPRIWLVPYYLSLSIIAS